MLRMDEEARQRLWDLVVAEIQGYVRNVDDRPVVPQDGPEKIRETIAAYDFADAVAPEDVVRFAAQQLSRNQVHTPSAHYYGLFNPCPTDISVVADAMVAAFNPQLAAWNHSPFAIELEQHLVRTFGALFGYSRDRVDGTFTTGGAEANHTALLCALTHRFAQFRQKGLRGIALQPTIYVSAEAHHSMRKAARLCGLGTDAVREVPGDSNLQMDPQVLERFIADDKRAHCEPLLVVATLGTTSAGAIDPIGAIGEIAAKHHAWYHVDAAWGGGAAFLPEMRGALQGLPAADSITFDCHKWLSVPMAAGMFLTRHSDVLDRTFRVAADYMPKDGTEQGFVDPYAHSIQWSRRFIGLKVFMSLAAAGLDGYRNAIREQVRVGAHLKARLVANGWQLANETPLPIACFHSFEKSEQTQQFAEAVAKAVTANGEAWLSTTKVGSAMWVLRACVTNFRTTPADVDRLIELLNRARESARAAGGVFVG